MCLLSLQSGKTDRLCQATKQNPIETHFKAPFKKLPVLSTGETRPT